MGRKVFLRGSKFAIKREMSKNTLNGLTFQDVYIQILVLSIFEINQGVTILKKPQEDLINWYLPFTTPIHHRSVMLMSCMTQSCNIKAIGSDKAVATPKIEFWSCGITFCGNVLSFRYDELDVVLAIQFSCRCIKFR